MTQKIFNTAMTAACFIGLVAAGSAVHAAPSETPVCVGNAIAQYNDSKAASLVCLDQLEADINEGIEKGVTISPAIIQVRTEECLSLEMTSEQRQAAIKACHQINQSQGYAAPPNDQFEQAATSDASTRLKVVGLARR